MVWIWIWRAEEVEEVFDRVIGKECLYDSPSEVWEDASAHPDKYLPMGSNGSSVRLYGRTLINII